jgi:hypothetical protein
MSNSLVWFGHKILFREQQLRWRFSNAKDANISNYADNLSAGLVYYSAIGNIGVRCELHSWSQRPTLSYMDAIDFN